MAAGTPIPNVFVLCNRDNAQSYSYTGSDGYATTWSRYMSQNQEPILNSSESTNALFNPGTSGLGPESFCGNILIDTKLCEGQSHFIRIDIIIPERCPWTKKETEALITLWEQGLRPNQIWQSEFFPNRTVNALRKQLRALGKRRGRKPKLKKDEYGLRKREDRAQDTLFVSSSSSGDAIAQRVLSFVCFLAIFGEF